MKLRTSQLILMVIWIGLAISRVISEEYQTAVLSLFIAFYCLLAYSLMKHSDQMDDLNDEIIKMQEKRINHLKSFIERNK